MKNSSALRIKESKLRQIVRSVLKEEAWVPGRFYPGGEPLDADDEDRLGRELGEVDAIDEIEDVDLPVLPECD